MNNFKKHNTDIKQKRRTVMNFKKYLLILVAALSLSGCTKYVIANPIENELPSENSVETNAENVLTVSFLDVGQGDATLLSCNGENMLIDAGENDQGTRVQNYLQKQGVESLKYVVGTHPHSDHIGGLDVVITKFDVENVILPKKDTDTRTYDDVIQSMIYKDITPIYPEIGDTFSLGSAEITILAPGDHNYRENLNDYSIALLVENGEDTFLFTGDAEEEAEYNIIKEGYDISADVYQVGHHGSRTSSSEEFLDAVNPECAVISCGENNEYGHPHAETLNKFRERGIKVYRTDEEGTIIATSTGNEITFDVPPSDTWKSGEPTINSTETEKSKYTGTYVLNTSSKKIHIPGCSGAEKISDENKQVTDYSKEQLVELGYSPCGICKP